MNLTKKIFTNRLILRKVSISVASLAYKNWMGDEEVTKFLRWKAHKNIFESEKIIETGLNLIKMMIFFNGLLN